MILKLFDSLKPLDQYLLKCAAVLGETVDRKMLEKLMERTNLRDVASCSFIFFAASQLVKKIAISKKINEE